MKLIGTILVPAVFILIAGNLSAQSDLDLFAQGQAALQHDDCYAARAAFESESQGARQSVAWLDTTAQAAECSRDPATALKYYEMEAAFGSNDSLISKIGNLRYSLSVNVPEATQQVLDWIGSIPPVKELENNLPGDTTFSRTATFGVSAFGSHPNQCTFKLDSVVLFTQRASSADSSPVVAQQRVTNTASINLYVLDQSKMSVQSNRYYDTLMIAQWNSDSGMRSRKVVEDLVGNEYWFIKPEGTSIQTEVGMAIITPPGQGARGLTLFQEAIRRCRIYYGHE